jgi:hypothetical protein
LHRGDMVVGWCTLIGDGMCKWRGIERTKSQSEGKRCGEEVVRINEEYRRLNDATEASAERLGLWDYPAAMRNKAVLFGGVKRHMNLPRLLIERRGIKHAI